MNPSVVVAEVWDGEIRPATWELVAAARKIRELTGAGVAGIRVLVPGENPAGPAGQIAERTGLDVLALRWPVRITPETLTSGLKGILAELSPSFVIMAHSTLGREAAPALAARLGWGAVSGAIGMDTDGNGIRFQRPVMDNTMVQTVRPAPGCPCILTLVPGSIGQDRETAVAPGKVTKKEARPSSPRVIRKEMRARAGGGASGPDIRTAPIVVAAGQGIGEPENIEKIFAFAGRLPKAAVGASRPLVDRGLLPYSRQVGITGALVAPKLYVACGISGSSQHLAGMAGARWVVSINKSEDAPIFRHSDLVIRADVADFLAAFLDEDENGEPLLTSPENQG